jgi:hypothetical protein
MGYEFEALPCKALRSGFVESIHEKAMRSFWFFFVFSHFRAFVIGIARASEVADNA